MRISGKPTTRTSFYRHLKKEGAGWIEYVYDETIYQKVLFATLTKDQIKTLYIFHHAADDTYKVPFNGIYKPLGISYREYRKKFFTLAEIVRLLKPRSKKLFRTRKLFWYWIMNRHHNGDHIDMVKHPIVLRSLAIGGHEIIDGNRRLIAKAMKEGFNFKCRAYVLTN